MEKENSNFSAVRPEDVLLRGDSDYLEIDQRMAMSSRPGYFTHLGNRPENSLYVHADTDFTYTHVSSDARGSQVKPGKLMGTIYSSVGITAAFIAYEGIVDRNVPVAIGGTLLAVVLIKGGIKKLRRSLQ